MTRSYGRGDWWDTYPTPRIVNLTPHPLVLSFPDGTTSTIESTGIARCEATEEEIGGIRIPHPVGFGFEQRIPIVRTTFGAVSGLPPADHLSAVYVVSSITAQACRDRDDVFVPALRVRDELGRIIACQALGKI
jgi:hypothetical protein